MKRMRSLKSNKRLTKDSLKDLKEILDEKVFKYNHPSFIEEDPICIPHEFSRLQDIEIAAFWTAMLSWGNRKTIISKSRELMALMDWSPHEFVLYHKDSDLKKLEGFKHRTFQPVDALYFISFFKNFYSNNSSLQEAFLDGTSMKERLTNFHNRFFSLPDLFSRTRKHVSTPAKNSSCKRLNMFLRWMVRKDKTGVDFGLWDGILASELMIPLDIHVFNVSRNLGLLSRHRTDWSAVEELTSALRLFDAGDPVKYDFALFSMGVLEKS